MNFSRHSGPSAALMKVRLKRMAIPFAWMWPMWPFCRHFLVTKMSKILGTGILTLRKTVHTKKLNGWNLKMMGFQVRNPLFQEMIFRFHVKNFRGIHESSTLNEACSLTTKNLSNDNHHTPTFEFLELKSVRNKPRLWLVTDSTNQIPTSSAQKPFKNEGCRLWVNVFLKMHFVVLILTSRMITVVGISYWYLHFPRKSAKIAISQTWWRK